MNTELAIVDPKQFGLEEAKAKEIKKGLEITLAEREILKQQYEDVIGLEITPESIKLFKNLRMQIRDNRTKGIMVWHKENKEFYLRGGQFVDAIKNKEILVNEQMEEKLENAEKYFENLEKQKIAQLQLDRVEMLRPYEVENLEQLDLGNMDTFVFDSFLSGVKTSFEAKKEREAKAEAERIAKEKEEADAREAQRLENERLKKEAEDREAEIEAERKANEDKARKDKEAADKVLEEEREKARIAKQQHDKEQAELKAKQDAILEAERKERARIEKELQDKKDAEAKEEQAKKDAEEKAKKDAEKLAKQSLQEQRQAWIDRFAMPETELSDVKTKEIQARFAGFITWATQTNNQ